MAQYKLIDLFIFTTYVATMIGLGNFLFTNEPVYSAYFALLSAIGVIVGVILDRKFVAAISEGFFILCLIRITSELWRILDLWVQ